MSKEITIDKLTIGNKLTSRETDIEAGTKSEFIMSSQGSTFKGYSDALRAQVPTTWGGTKPV